MPKLSGTTKAASARLRHSAAISSAVQIDLPCCFDLRFVTQVAGIEFTAEVECETLRDAQETIKRLAVHTPPATLTAAQPCFQLAKPDGGGCYLLDDESQELLSEVLGFMNLGAEHFYNHRMGSYDKLNNVITPVDFGTVFPDGTMRLVWRAGVSRLGLEESYAIVKMLLESLVHMQSVPHFCATEQEYEDGETKGLKDRRSAGLFALGLWPADDDTFCTPTSKEISVLFAKYANQAFSATEASSVPGSLEWATVSLQRIEAIAAKAIKSGHPKDASTFAGLVGMSPDRFSAEMEGGHQTVLAQKLAARLESSNLLSEVVVWLQDASIE